MLSPSPPLVVRLFLLLACVIHTKASHGEPKGPEKGSLAVPSFTLEELRLGTRLHDLSMVLRSTGLLSVKVDSPQLQHSMHRNVAMNGLCSCLQDPFWDDSDHKTGGLEGVDTVMLDDDFTVRTTVATATVGKDPLPLASKDTLEMVCGADTVDAMEVLRDQVALVSDAFVHALDTLVHGGDQYHFDASRDIPMLRDVNGGSYQTLQSVVKAANHLEHFHYYRKDGKVQETDDKDSITLQWHTDAGLFLAFVPAWDCPSSGLQKDESFWVKLPTGEEVRAEFEDGTIAVMLGSGAEHWLKTPLGLRATHHAVDMKPGDSRTWYGMMNLVPESAIIQDTPARTFGDMKNNMKISGAHQRVYGEGGDHETVAIGCGPAEPISSTFLVKNQLLDAELGDAPMRRRRLQHVSDASYCNNATNFFCWVQCLDIPNYQQAEGYITEGLSLYCMDPGILASSGNQVSKAIEPCGDFVHNSNCMGVWHTTAAGYPGQTVEYNATIIENDVYCYGGTSMYMDGFHWIHQTTCVIYLFPGWVLSTRGKFAAACIGTIILGILVEYVIFNRRKTMIGFEKGYGRLAASSAFYGLQLTLGYIIMLVVMTYSIPLCMCCVLGFVCGHILFNAKDAIIVEMANKPKKNDELPEQTDRASTKEFFGNTRADYGATSGEDDEEEIPSCCASKKKKVEDENQGVPEGITPCCQNVL